MSLIQRFLLGNRVDDDLQVGLFLKNDGTVWLRNPDRSETLLSAGATAPAVLAAVMNVPAPQSNIQEAPSFAAATTEDEVSAFVSPSIVLTTVPYTVGNGAVIVQFAGTGTIGIYNVPAVSFEGTPLVAALDGYLYVTDLTGENTFYVEPRSNVTLPVGPEGGFLDWSGADPTIVGDDLVWDSAALTLTSTNGGTYTGSFVFRMGYGE